MNKANMDLVLRAIEQILDMAAHEVANPTMLSELAHAVMHKDTAEAGLVMKGLHDDILALKEDAGRIFEGVTGS